MAAKTTSTTDNNAGCFPCTPEAHQRADFEIQTQEKENTMELITLTTLDAQLAEIGDMLHRIHACQRGLSAARLPTASKYLSPRQQAMTSLAIAQNGLEGAELALTRLVSALDQFRSAGS